ncbi:MAG: hypothetical protein WCG01_04265 [bacterium]
MALTQERLLEKVNTSDMTWLLGLVGIATFLPFVIHLQLLTGPIINAILIITLIVLGVRSALVVALIPSIMALAGGLLPLVLAPTVPFIMLSNVIMILVLDYIYNLNLSLKGFGLGILVGAFFKSLFLYVLATFVMGLINNPVATSMVPKLFGILQFVTALAGGLIAFGFLKFVKRL